MFTNATETHIGAIKVFKCPTGKSVYEHIYTNYDCWLNFFNFLLIRLNQLLVTAEEGRFASCNCEHAKTLHENETEACFEIKSILPNPLAVWHNDNKDIV